MDLFFEKIDHQNFGKNRWHLESTHFHREKPSVFNAHRLGFSKFGAPLNKLTLPLRIVSKHSKFPNGFVAKKKGASAPRFPPDQGSTIF